MQSLMIKVNQSHVPDKRAEASVQCAVHTAATAAGGGGVCSSAGGKSAAEIKARSKRVRRECKRLACKDLFNHYLVSWIQTSQLVLSCVYLDSWSFMIR